MIHPVDAKLESTARDRDVEPVQQRTGILQLGTRKGGARMGSIREATTSKLLEQHAAVAKALRQRGVLTTNNNPIGDLAVYLCCRAFGWKRENNSRKGYDATGIGKIRYEIKGLQLLSSKQSRQLSAIRDIRGGHFHMLAGVMMDARYKVLRACLIPHDIVLRYGNHIEHTNSHRFMLTDAVWSYPNVKDITKELKAAVSNLDGKDAE